MEGRGGFDLMDFCFYFFIQDIQCWLNVGLVEVKLYFLVGILGFQRENTLGSLELVYIVGIRVVQVVVGESLIYFVFVVCWACSYFLGVMFDGYRREVSVQGEVSSQGEVG